MKIKLILAASIMGAASLAVLPLPAVSQDNEVRVGYMSGFPGGRGIYARDMRDGFLLALDHLGGKLGGIPAKVIIGDTQHKPDVGRQVMDKFIKKDKVHFVAGITWSNVLAAVYKQALKNKTFLKARKHILTRIILCIQLHTSPHKIKSLILGCSKITFSSVSFRKGHPTSGL